MEQDSVKSGGVKKNSGARKRVAKQKKEAATEELVKNKKVAGAKKMDPEKNKLVNNKKELVKEVAANIKGKADSNIVENSADRKQEIIAVENEKPKKVEKSKKETFVLSKTTFVKPAEVKKSWLILDAKGKSLGRVASVAASLLRGKHKVDFTPNVDCGDNVIIVNCVEAVLTGKKLQQKVHYRHSGWIGGLKKVSYSELMKKFPEKAMTMAVEGMLPGGSLGAKMARHLRTYRDGNHKHEAQKPKVFEF